MADPTLDATAKGASANSYVTRADAQTYFNGRNDADPWENADDADKDRSLMTATARLEREDYHGSITTQTQRLHHPRSGLVDKDSRNYSQDTISLPVQEATYELALAVLNGSWVPSDTGLESFAKVKVGPLDVTPERAYTASTLPQIVVDLLESIRIGSFSMNIPVKRG